MSVYITTHNNKKTTQAINSIVGKPFNVWNRILMGGIGSPRLMIEKVSLQLDMVMNERTQVNYATIEIRPKGIIMHFSKGIQSFAWVIPYFRLSLFTGDQLTIHGEGNYARLRKDKQSKEVYEFFKRIINEKAKYTESLQL